MIKSKVGSIKSGWRSVFMIFTAAADDELESIVESAFENVEQGKSLPSSHLFLCLSFYVVFLLLLVIYYISNLQKFCSYIGTL